jgi:flagellar biogenesis protein FliO
MNLSAPIAEGQAAPLASAGSRFFSFLKRAASAACAHRSERRLRLCEMLPLGEKRFVAVIEYGAEKFILAGTPQRISLLQRIERNRDEPEAAREPRESENAQDGPPEKRCL